MSRLGQHEVGHEGVITGCDALSLRSSMCSLQGLICDANPQGVAQPPLQSTYLHSRRLTKVIHYFW
ncbi:hypothetical protein [Lysinibacillus sp. Bpr_S20]|uniref:hypothetical protein n=1 Tax=Lysinibacillus sp. Bpr_S20 TaxID=2933964 RepID=UPI0020133C5C|nr:hypothetical protein [Lysinibacillus sp. Bpr_S20]MCL1702775.1 hypothetical protein [Lysinibacillus sp. Bpr_S20]